MEKYRSIPTVVEAVRFDPHGEHRLKLPDGVHGCPSPGADNWAYEGCTFEVVTIQGQRVRISAGEWVVTEPDGIHHYPIAHDVFIKKYELMEHQP